MSGLRTWLAGKNSKDYPIASGVLAYFPLALAAIARVSVAGNQQHNPGEPLHWDRTKSRDHLDAALRHLADLGIDTDGVPHIDKAAWRLLAACQEYHEAELLPIGPPADGGAFPDIDKIPNKSRKRRHVR